MPLTSIKLHPGIVSVATPTLNEGGWASASNMRFFEGLAQKDAGFTDLLTDAAFGTVRALKAWTALSGISYLGIGGQPTGSFPKVAVWNGTVETNITPAVISPSDTVSLDNWGEFLLICYGNGPVYVWQPAIGGVATNVATAPQQNTFIFVAIQQQQLICCGTINAGSGDFDPMLIRWSDTGDYTQFTPAVTNQSGSFRLPTGSKITAGLVVSGQNLIWTDIALYSMSYIQYPLVWGFQPLGLNCGAVGPHAVGILGGRVFWMGQNQFFELTGGEPQPIPCPVWDQVFPDVDRLSIDLVTCETDSYYGEVAWSVPQQDGTVMRARLQVASGAWTASTYHSHTAWIDQNPFGAPIGGHSGGVVDQHDTGWDAAGAAAATSLTSGIIMIAEGEETTFVRSLIPDVKILEGDPSLSLTVSFYDYPDKAPRTKGPYTLDSTTQVVHPRGRGRGIQFTITSDTLGAGWRLGNFRYDGNPDGRR